MSPSSPACRTCNGRTGRQRLELGPMLSVYARYPSDQQREASIEGQVRLCRLYAEKQGWSVSTRYHDRAASDASLIRRGVDEAFRRATEGRQTDLAIMS